MSYSVLQSSTKYNKYYQVVFRNTKYCYILQSIAPYYKVLLRAAKYYSVYTTRTDPFYKVLAFWTTTYFCLLQKHHSPIRAIAPTWTTHLTHLNRSLHPPKRPSQPTYSPLEPPHLQTGQADPTYGPNKLTLEKVDLDAWSFLVPSWDRVNARQHKRDD